MCERARARVCVCVRACVYVCVCVCACAGVCVCAPVCVNMEVYKITNSDNNKKQLKPPLKVLLTLNESSTSRHTAVSFYLSTAGEKKKNLK